MSAQAQFSCADLMRGALEFHAAGQLQMARDLYTRVLAIDPAEAMAWHHLGLVAHAFGDHATAVAQVRKAIAVQPDYVQAHANLAAIFRALRDLPEAAACAERAIALDPNFAPAHSNLGNIREDQGEFEAALASYRDACRIDPHFIEAHTNAANLLRRLKRYEEALAVCDRIVERRPDSASVHFCAGNILRELLRGGEAIAAFRQAIALNPRFAEAHCNLGNLLLRQDAYEEAIAAYQEAIAINPEIAQTYCNLGAAYELARRPAEALEAYGKALARDPSLIGVEVQICHQRRAVCDWNGLREAERRLIARLASCEDAVPPFAFLCMETSAADQLQVARLWARALHARRCFTHRPPAVAEPRKLRIGYLSGDFHRHATAMLMAELFERHDRTRFEIIAYSYGMDDCSEIRHRLGRAFDEFVDLRNFDDRQAADRINADRIDILVELKGYTQSARSEIAAHRPAPIQVNFLGYPGTMGCDFIDYVIADPITLPLDQQPFYDEKIVHLPDCYQPNDRQRRVADLTPSRADCGLPEDGFVFCCFNNSFKLTPRFFDIWMRLLAAVPGSVLWLFDANAQVEANLRKEAALRGVDPARLVFAPRIGPTNHLARQRLADLFLDCLPYNAHTTTSDALWVGLPVITLIGETFAGRVAASLLHAIGLPELVTYSEAEYETLALQLATEPQRLADLRRKLSGNRATHPLFDTERYARHLEAAFVQMWERWSHGLPVEPFSISPLPKPERPLPPQTGAAPTRATTNFRLRYASCPLCSSADRMPFLVADGSRHPAYNPEFDPAMNWLACRSCGHIFTEGYFAEGCAPIAQAEFGADLDRGRRLAAPVVARVAHHIAQGAWLDVEVGDGSLLFTAAEWGFEPVGLDPHADTVATLRRLGIEAHGSPLTCFAQAHRFGVLSLRDYLPRQPFPLEALKSAHALLDPGGVLLLTMPNRDAIQFDLLQVNAVNPHWSAFDHYHMFGRKRLYRLLRDCGFEPVDYQISAAHRVGMEVIARKIP